MREKKGAFEGISGDIELLGVVTCGDCPGEKAVTRVREMVACGAEVIGYACPFAKKMMDAVKQVVDDSIEIIDYMY